MSEMISSERDRLSLYGDYRVVQAEIRFRESLKNCELEIDRLRSKLSMRSARSG